ncbi:MAG: adenosylmethionine decarboxylase [Planctomycetia bacterium]
MIPQRCLGRHVLGEFYDCKTLPDDPESIREAMEAAAREIDATIVQSVFHSFNPYGVSGVLVIAESHLAIHTWPEHGIASVDLYTCSMSIHPRRGFEYLKEVFQAGWVDVVEMPRGAGVNFEAVEPDYADELVGSR